MEQQIGRASGKPVKGSCHHYTELEKLGAIEEYGQQIIGEHFIIVRFERGKYICSFVLTGYNAKGYIYTCIYCEL